MLIARAQKLKEENNYLAVTLKAGGVLRGTVADVGSDFLVLDIYCGHIARDESTVIKTEEVATFTLT
jgi:hypothetical protein